MINVLNKIIDFILPNRATMKGVIDELVKRCERSEAENEKNKIRLDELEKKIETDTCYRRDCKYRVNINKLLQSEICSAGENKDSPNAQD